MMYSEKTDALIPALFAARKDMSSGAKKNTKNVHLKSSYANLESFLAAIRPALEANGLMLQQAWEKVPDGERLTIYLTTQVMHVSGQSVTVVSPFPVVKPDAHGVGSAITYARRYAIACLFGIAQSDDDGNATVVTSTDFVKLIKDTDNAVTLEKILTKAKRPDYFGSDTAAMKVITGAYNDRKRELSKVGETFNAAAAAAAASQPEAKAQPEQEATQAAPGEFDQF